ncbi:MAG: PleD family two-component system response regulator [Pyrinomonadaceae bacterium]
MAGEPRKLLLADDSITIQKVIDLTFADEGFDVTTVGNGEQAIEQLAAIMPDIVLADVFMPGKSGYEVCAHIKNNAQFQHIPVILLVGSFEPFNETEARRVGADDVLTKPFQSIRQLVNKVGALLGGEEKHDAEENAEQTAAAPAPPSDATLMMSAPHREAEAARIFDHPETGFTQDSARDSQTPNDDTPAPVVNRDAPDISFADAAMDDEMIEATPVYEFNRQQETAHHAVEHSAPPEVVEEADVMETAETTHTSEESSDAGDETLLSIAPVVVPNAHAGEEQSISTPNRAAPHISSQTFGTAADDALLDLGDMASPSAATAEADDFILDLRDTFDEAPASSPTPAPPPAAIDANADMDAATFVDYEAEITEAAPQSAAYAEAQDTVEGQREEFAPVENQGADAYTTTRLHPPATEHTSFDNETPHEDYAASPELSVPQWQTAETQTSAESVSETAPQNSAPSAGAQLNLDQLSPEMIDLIARRVVEHLSEKVVQEIAWEVVPQLAELMIKRRLEEENSQAQ